MKLQAKVRTLRGLLCALIVSGGFVHESWCAARAQRQAGSASHSVTAPPDPQIWFAKGQAALQVGDLDSAEADFRKVTAADPTSGAAYANLGVIAMRRKQWDHALALLQKAEKLDPKMTGIRLNIGLVKYRRGDYAGAIKPLTAVVREQPDSQQARYLLGLSNVFTEHYAAAVAVLKDRLIARATVLTPNIPEAEALLGRPIAGVEEMADAAMALQALGAQVVVLKGGHLPGARIRDVVMEGAASYAIECPRIETRHTHGTGCTLASAIATGLAQGMAMRAAIERAHDFVQRAIRTAPGYGQGRGPLNHAPEPSDRG